MPTYDYRCTACAAVFEEQYSVADRDYPLDCVCPECGGDSTLERFLAGAPGVSYSVGDGVRKKTPNAFKDLLRNIKSKHLHNTIDV